MLERWRVFERIMAEGLLGTTCHWWNGMAENAVSTAIDVNFSDLIPGQP